MMTTDHFDQVTQKFGDLRYMNENQAAYLRDFVAEKEIETVLELGFCHGKSSAYWAAILEDLGKGHLTTIDKCRGNPVSPSIDEVLDQLGLSHRVDYVFAHRSFTWELAKLIQQNPRPQFDVCYLDGGHTWDITNVGFLLVDLLLKPGGWIIFDDLDWTISKSVANRPKTARDPWITYSQDERDAKGVRMVWELIVPEFGYVNRSEVPHFQWGVAQKPLAR